MQARKQALQLESAPAVAAQEVHEVQRREACEEVLQVEQQRKQRRARQVVPPLYAHNAPQQDACARSQARLSGYLHACGS